ncbi:hypothetical protein HAX54_037500 [Datura stramonium]|uniref:2-C-methyl-D-erythritol 4-phosphate cytidylyltransferase n=1 Tax=Datura stramonium TaxID=4076 RepID=A0ABS8SH73_DATST|nr:hypothetical protein [Datura stramonium]
MSLSRLLALPISPNLNKWVEEKSVSVILLAGGKERMGASMPKQYLPLLGQPIALYSFYTFSKMPQVKEIIVVCDPQIKIFLKIAISMGTSADTKEVDSNSKLACIHDSARPLVQTEDVEKVLKDGWLVGAAVLGVPAKATIKEANSESFCQKTLDRKTLWEMQTLRISSALAESVEQICLAQIIKPELLKKGFELVNRKDFEVTVMMYQ